MSQTIKILLPIFLLLILTTPCFSATDTFGPDPKVSPAEVVRYRLEDKKLRILIGPSYYWGSGAGLSITGIGGELALHHPFSKKWGLGFGFRQYFSASGFAAYVSDASVKGIFALAGSLTLQQENLSQGENQAAQMKGDSEGSLQIQAFFSESFFTTTSAGLPFSGVGIALAHESYPSTSSFGYTFGVRAERITNSNQTLYPVQAFICLAIWP